MRRLIPRTRGARLALLLAAVLLAVVLVWWRGPEMSLLRDAFTAVHLRWVIAAIGLNLLSVVARAIAWHAVIYEAMPEPRPRFRSVFSAFSVGLLGNAVLPGRIGEVARVAVLARRLPRGRGTWATLAGTVVAHRVFDVVAVSLLVLYVLAEARIPAWAISSLAAFVAIGLTAFAVTFAGARRHQSTALDGLGHVRRFVRLARVGLGVMRAPRAAAAASVMQVVGWTYQLLAVYATMRAFQIDEPLVAAALVLVLMNVAMIFPLWPGNVGLVQAAVALPLVSYGIVYPHGFAFGIGLQAIEASVGVVLGLAFLTREGLSMATLRDLPREDDVDPADEPPGRSLRNGRESRARARVPG